jgi:hypothetical protein
MSLIKRPNSSNWYYLFQIQGRKYFGSTQTPKKDVGQAPLLADQLRGVDALAPGEVGELNQVPAGIVKDGDDGAGGGCDRHRELHAFCGQAIVLRLDVADQELSGGLALAVQRPFGHPPDSRDGLWRPAQTAGVSPACRCQRAARGVVPGR